MDANDTNNEAQTRAQWQVDLNQIAARLDDLNAEIGALLHLVQTRLSEEIAALQADLERLETDMGAAGAAGADMSMRQIIGRIKELSAMGDAAYRLLQADMPERRDRTETEIKTLEAVAASAVEPNRARLTARINHLKARQATERASRNIAGDNSGK